MRNQTASVLWYPEKGNAAEPSSLSHTRISDYEQLKQLPLNWSAYRVVLSYALSISTQAVGSEMYVQVIVGRMSRNCWFLKKDLLLCGVWCRYCTSTKTQQDRQRTYKRNNEERSCSHYCSGTAVRIKYSACASVALLTRYAKRKRLLYFRLWPVLLYHIYSHRAV